MVDPLDFRLPDDLLVAPSENTPKRVRRKRVPWFLKGPIPGDWIEGAQGPCKNLATAFACWHAVDVNGGILSAKILRRFGIGRRAAKDSLTRLEAAGLIHVDRRDGACPRVTILHLQPLTDAELRKEILSAD
jgi:hypothetical protein